MQPSARTQPHRRSGAREPGPALDAMLRGATLYGQHPGGTRKTQKRKRKRKAGALSRRVAALRGVRGRSGGR